MFYEMFDQAGEVYAIRCGGCGRAVGSPAGPLGEETNTWFRKVHQGCDKVSGAEPAAPETPQAQRSDEGRPSPKRGADKS